MGSREEEEGQERDGKGERVENEKLRLQKVCDGDNSNKDMNLGGKPNYICKSECLFH